MSISKKYIYNAIIISIVVGSILNIINSYEVIVEGDFTKVHVLKIVLTYITPFCVSLYSSIKASKS